MYELFVKNYLRYIKTAKREQIEKEKLEAITGPIEDYTKTPVRDPNDLDDELADYLSFLYTVGNNALNP